MSGANEKPRDEFAGLGGRMFRFLGPRKSSNSLAR